MRVCARFVSLDADSATAPEQLTRCQLVLDPGSPRLFFQDRLVATEGRLKGRGPEFYGSGRQPPEAH
jgi:hypothetical protein